MSTDQKDKNKKITDYTKKISNLKSADKTDTPTKVSQKRPISPDQSAMEKRSNQPKRDIACTKMNDASKSSLSAKSPDSIELMENYVVLNNALGPLISEFQLLRESVNAVHVDYADLKQTISKQKSELQQELVNKIDNNTKQLNLVAQENKSLRKENELLKTRLDKLEQSQLINNVMVMGIQEGPYEQYNTTKL